MNGGRRGRPRRLAPPRKPRSKEDPREAKARDRARIPGPARERRPFTSPRPGTSARPASRPSPTRPAPQSQSLFRSYGSNLPTSLTYIILSTRGSLPWRPAADMGTNRRDTSTWPSPGFSRSEGKIRTPPQLRCSSRSKPYLPARGFQGTRTLIQKRKLFPDLPTASPGHFGLPRRTLLREPELYAVPLPGSGIGTGFPFARRACVIIYVQHSRRTTLRLHNTWFHRLRPIATTVTERGVFVSRARRARVYACVFDTRVYCTPSLT